MYLRNNPASVQALLNAMAKDVHRHVDHVGAVKVEWDTKSECSHCGYEWETVTDADLATGDYEGHALGEPMCCERAAAEFHAEQSQTRATPSSP